MSRGGIVDVGRAVLRVRERGLRRADQVLLVVADERRKRGVDLLHNAFEVDDHHAGGRVVEDGAEAAEGQRCLCSLLVGDVGAGARRPCTAARGSTGWVLIRSQRVWP